ncbi:rhamnulokinase [Demequina muriae]|uniref:Rhamnulokinase family protein n=1 Tax=Demequina muriae TaxID=3051664 RepID=A0ABT8GI08_9MICO|nr:rhamnulokinase family protein [Demequina sp. EGI L300058]MDN4481058.1 rhamnulokinase family protein [Demequina sp. EGI L300058]
MTAAVAAIDLGATSGRVVVGHVGSESLRIRQVARFPNGAVALPDGLHWNTQGLHRAALDGLRDAVSWEKDIASVGIDSWAVDYALLRRGRTLGEPFHYRDARNAPAVEKVHSQVPFEALYARNGLQFLPFNTVYQLAAEDPAVLGVADSLLLVPDLLGFWLTGRAVTERTNASTTGLLDVATRDWDLSLLDALGIDSGLLPALVDAGEAIGPLLAAPAQHTGLRDARVIAVGSHDTASAVVATPMRESGGAYISCGTWGLVGVETERPVLSDDAREANFTNEGGVDGRTRFLHNVMGLWLLSESVRAWERDGEPVALERLLAEATAIGPDVPVFDANDPVFMAPGDMPERIAQWCAGRGLRTPTTRAEFARSIIESLAVAFADAVTRASALSGQRVDTIHLVGGGAQNELLCQRTADRSGLTVVAGPVEATALGNVLVQGRALGAIGGTLESMRDLVRRTFSPRTFEPTGA